MKVHIHITSDPIGSPIMDHPRETQRLVSLVNELRTLFRPFIYLNRKRIWVSSHPGDARRYGTNMFCLNRLLGSPLGVSKMPRDYGEALKAGVDRRSYHKYLVLRELMLMHAQQPESSSLPAQLQAIADLKPQSHLEDRKYYASSEKPPAESILPPALHTLTGLRGLLCYRETLQAIVNKNPEAQRTALGDQEADKKLEKLLLSMFQSAWQLSQVQGELTDNSDGDTDSDEEMCFTSQVPVEHQYENQKEESLPDQVSMAQASIVTEKLEKIMIAVENIELTSVTAELKEIIKTINKTKISTFTEELEEVIQAINQTDLSSAAEKLEEIVQAISKTKLS